MISGLDFDYGGSIKMHSQAEQLKQLELDSKPRVNKEKIKSEYNIENNVQNFMDELRKSIDSDIYEIISRNIRKYKRYSGCYRDN